MERIVGLLGEDGLVWRRRALLVSLHPGRRRSPSLTRFRVGLDPFRSWRRPSTFTLLRARLSDWGDDGRLLAISEPRAGERRHRFIVSRRRQKAARVSVPRLS